MRIVNDDGGRKAAGYEGKATGDCVCRAVAIASGRPYQEVLDRLNEGKRTQRLSKYEKVRGIDGRKRGASDGVQVQRKWFRDYMAELGFEWIATMKIGSGCKVHLRDGELPMGRLVVNLSRHMTAVIDGVVHDTHDPRRGGDRCVYGYFRLKDKRG